MNTPQRLQVGYGQKIHGFMGNTSSPNTHIFLVILFWHISSILFVSNITDNSWCSFLDNVTRHSVIILFQYTIFGKYTKSWFGRDCYYNFFVFYIHQTLYEHSLKYRFHTAWTFFSSFPNMKYMDSAMNATFLTRLGEITDWVIINVSK